MSIQPINFFETLQSVGLLTGQGQGGHNVSSLALFSDIERFSFCSSKICKDWKTDILQKLNLFDSIEKDRQEQKHQYLSRIAFGAEEWAKYFGDVGKEPLLPDNIIEILESPCPIWGGNNKTSETHILVLIPERVCGQPLTLNSLNKFVQEPLLGSGGHSIKYKSYNSNVQQQYGDTPVSSSHWVLFSKDVIPNSCGKYYLDQKRLVEDLRKKTNLGYEEPHALEAAAALLMHHVRTGERLYYGVFTRCQEVLGNDPVSIGGFFAKGLSIDYHHYKFNGRSSGMAVSRKL